MALAGVGLRPGVFTYSCCAATKDFFHSANLGLNRSCLGVCARGMSAGAHILVAGGLQRKRHEVARF